MQWLRNALGAIGSWAGSDASPGEKNSRVRSRSPSFLEDEMYHEDVPQDEEASLGTPVGARPRRTPDHSAEKRRAVVSEFSKDNQNAIIYGMFTAQMQKLQGEGRSNLSSLEAEALLKQVHVASGVQFNTIHALKQRVYRMDDKGTPMRATGSGAPKKWTPEMENVTKGILRRYGGEISGAQAYDDFVAQLGPVVSERTFLRYLADKETFKRRRSRLKPALTEQHKRLRVAFAQYILQLPYRVRMQIIYLDEKLFQAYCHGKLLLPAEDGTPTKFVQSKSNMTQAMVLVALMEPRGHFDGVVAHHTFTERLLAKKNSRNRQAGTIVKKTVNVNAAQYYLAFKESILPELKRLVGLPRLQNSAGNPFYFQDDNAKPHRGQFDGIMVQEAIVALALSDFGLFVRFLDPSQPAQSPDTNPLDQFFFRCLYQKYRRLRAQARVKWLLEGGASSVGDEELPGDISDDENDENDKNSDDGAFLKQRGRVPIRCCPPETGKSAKCAGCGNVVRNNDFSATKCDLRGSWWHNDCAEAKLIEYGNVRGVAPRSVAEEDPWYCPQCAFHLCRGTHSTANLCVICGEPSKRSERVGSDMITCDSAFCGLFHKACVHYEEWERDSDDEIEWQCPICSEFLGLDDGSDELKQIDTVDVSENTVAGIEAAIKEALELVDRETIERGFETRKHFLQAIIDTDGGNTYEKHWRRASK